MKFHNNDVRLNCFSVAPYMGAWIEISQTQALALQIEVAPYMGAWIETCVRYGKQSYSSKNSVIGVYRKYHILGYAIKIKLYRRGCEY